MSDLVARLQQSYPGAQWVLTGDTYAGLQWLDTVIPKPKQADIPPLKVPVPAEVSNVQGHAVLIMYGIRDDAQAAIAAIADETERALAQLAFERGSFVRSSPMIAQVSTALGLSSDTVDEMFRIAKTVEI